MFLLVQSILPAVPAFILLLPQSSKRRAWLPMAWTTVMNGVQSSWMFMAHKSNSHKRHIQSLPGHYRRYAVQLSGQHLISLPSTDLILSVMAELRGSNTYPPQNSSLSEGPRQKKPKGEPP
ncbi:hypothetical protein PROFUN_17152, partial [Planoprotostelium fungivorum]